MKFMNFIKKHKDMVALSLIALFCLLGFSALYITKVRVSASTVAFESYLCSDTSDETIEIIPGTEVKQTFKSGKDISGVGVRFKTYSRENYGTINIKLIDQDTNTELEETNYDIANIKEDVITGFGFHQLLTNDKNYEIVITSSNTEPGHSVSLTTSKNDNYKDGKLYINGQDINADISLAVYSTNSPFIKVIYCIGAVIATIFLLLMYYAIFIKKLKHEKIFLLAAIFLGVAYMFLNSPYSNYDEPAHFDTAYRYSNDLLGIGHSTDDGDMFKRAEDNMLGLTPGPTSTSTYSTVYKELFSTSDDNTLVKVEGRDVKEPFYLYAMDTLAITIARLLNFGKVPTLMLAKLFNLAIYIVLTYFAIKKIPFAKTLLLSIGLLPMVLSQAGSLSYDSMIMGISFFFTAYCLYFAFGKEELTRRDYILFLLSVVLLAPIKAVYVFLVALCFVIPKNRLKTNKNYWKLFFGVLACVVVSYLGFNLVRTLSTMTSTSATSVFNSDPAYSFGDIFKMPVHFVKMLFLTMTERAVSYSSHAITAVYMININSMLTVAFVIILVLASFRHKDEKQYLSGWHRLLMAAIFFGIVILLFTVAFTWTPNDCSRIEGFQGRYMIPMMPILFMTLRNSNLMYKKSIDKALMMSICILQIITITDAFKFVIG